jgi:hypothetical protein
MKKKSSSKMNIFKKLLFPGLFIIFFINIFKFNDASSQDGFHKWMATENDSFQQYRDERDAEFVKFLENNWQEFQISSGVESDNAPKPEKIPKAPPQSLRPSKLLGVTGTLKKQIVPDEKPLQEPAKIPVMPPRPKEKDKRLEILFHNTPVTLYFDSGFSVEKLKGFNKKSISAFWEKMSDTDYESFNSYALEYKKTMKLNDWGFHYLLYMAGQKIHKGDKNMSRLFVWFMSSKAGYESKIGYKDDGIYLLMPSQNTLYGVSFLTLKGKRFYALFFDQKPEKLKKLFSYKGEYPEADKIMDYRLVYSPVIKILPGRRSIEFKYRERNYSFPVEFNRNLVDFYEYYPQTELGVYFTAAMPGETERAMLKNLKPIVEGLPEEEAAGLLLRFVQTVFEYKTDTDQFGREKFMYPAETLYYPYSDCEDRAFLFAWLAENLLNVKVVGLDYPGHVATGVKFSSDIKGDYVMAEGNKYTVCDPTYINAEPGMTMPEFRNLKPEIIILN